MSGGGVPCGGVPCGACRVLRRKCAENCLFAPYFSSEQMGVEQFRAILRVFGHSHFAKLLLPLPADKRKDAVASILYEAQARILNPVHGCSSSIQALQQENEKLRQQLVASYAQFAALRSLVDASQNINIAEYANAQHSLIPSSVSSSNSMPIPRDQQYYEWGDLESVISQNVGANDYPVGTTAADGGLTNFSMGMQGEYMSGDMSSLSTAQQNGLEMEMGAFYFGDEAWKSTQNGQSNFNNNLHGEAVQSTLSYPYFEEEVANYRF